MRRLIRGLTLCGLVLTAGTAQAAGSWVATAPPVRVAMADREAASAALVPGDGTAGRIAEVRWRYRRPAGAAIRARLCHPGGCMLLPDQRGRSEALAGLAAEAPLRFRFSLAPGQAPITVQGLQVIVNYR
ncbi:flagellar protein FlhE [Halomonas organivorans]